jgi:hypothetical protein
VASLFAAALFFVGIHFFISGTALRDKIVGIIGERAFQGSFSLMSLIGVVWLSRAYGQAEYVPLWPEPQGLRPVALAVMLVAFVSVVLAFTSPNPTAVGGGALLTEKEPEKGMVWISCKAFRPSAAKYQAAYSLENYFFMSSRYLFHAAMPASAAFSSMPWGSPATPTAPTNRLPIPSGTPPPTRYTSPGYMFMMPK